MFYALDTVLKCIHVLFYLIVFRKKIAIPHSSREWIFQSSQMLIVFYAFINREPGICSETSSMKTEILTGFWSA